MALKPGEMAALLQKGVEAGNKLKSKEPPLVMPSPLERKPSLPPKK